MPPPGRGFLACCPSTGVGPGPFGAHSPVAVVGDDQAIYGSRAAARACVEHRRGDGAAAAHIVRYKRDVTERELGLQGGRHDEIDRKRGERKGGGKRGEMESERETEREMPNERRREEADDRE